MTVKHLKLIAMASLLGLLIGTVSACNTMNGLGQDVSAGGTALSKAATNSK